MGQKVTVLSITGSDSTGGSGIQADIKSITSLGGYAASAITTVTAQDTSCIEHFYDIPSDVLRAQLLSVVRDIRPDAIKIGLLRSCGQVEEVASLLNGINCGNVVLDLVLVSANGLMLMDEAVVQAVVSKLFPLCSIVVMRLNNALNLLKRVEGYSFESPSAQGNALLSTVAQRVMRLGCRSLFLRGVEYSAEVYTDLYATIQAESAGSELGMEYRFFTRVGAIERALHGSAGAFTSALAFYMAERSGMEDALSSALAYVNRLILNSVDFKLGRGGTLLDHSNQPIPKAISARMLEVYNSLMNEIAGGISAKRNVENYAGMLNISPRYLAQVTRAVAGRSPKEIIDDCLIKEIGAELISGEKSMKQIASMYEFSSQAQLSKFVQKMCNCSPSEYKRLHTI